MDVLDVALTVDRYALWITLALVAVVSVRAGHRDDRGYPDDKAKKTLVDRSLSA